MCIPLSSLLFSYGRHSMNLSYDDNEMHNHKCQYGWKGLPKCQSFCFIGYGQDATLVIFHFCAKTIQYLKNPTSEKNAYGKMAMATTATTLYGRAYWCSSVSIRILPCEHQDAPVWASGCFRASIRMLPCEHVDALVWATWCSYFVIHMLLFEHQDAPMWPFGCSSVSIFECMNIFCVYATLLNQEHLDAPVWAYWCSHVSILMLPSEHHDAVFWCSRVSVHMLTRGARVDANLWASWC